MPADPDRVEQIFTQALGKAGADARAAYLHEACGNDTQLRQRVESLLAAHEATANFIPLPPANPATEPFLPLSEGPGTKIGRYKLLQQIGEGGFGVVFMAEQEHPVRRRVALKIIKLGMDTRQVVARFEAERQALAMMEHACIAKVLDAGATDTGRPYFVMELVKGVPITEYCDRHNLSVARRLELFAQVCQAVQHAHQKGLIHRDIKPSNVLVNTQDDRPAAKVIDFGIAKATQARLTDKTLFTEFRQLVGTPEYMSPEQAEGSLDVDTRSDIYSLGVLLYELLTGTTPFDARELRSKAFAEMQRIIREVEPPRPSTRLHTIGNALPTVAAHRAVEARRLDAQVRGELDWIVMKCLEKDRAMRYETANGLAMDLQRYLSDEPVLACPPSASYKLRKFARRYRAAMAIAAAFAVILMLGAAVSAWQAIRATRAEEIAIKERNSAEQARRDAVASAAAETVQRKHAEEISSYLTSAFQSPDPSRDGRTITIAEVLDRDARELSTKLADDPRTKATLLYTISRAYSGLGLYKDAIPLMESARDLRARALGPRDWETINAMNKLAEAYYQVKRFGEAEALVTETVKFSDQSPGPNDPNTIQLLVFLAAIYQGQGHSEKSLPILEDAVARLKTQLAPDDPALFWPMHNLADAYRYAKRIPEAMALDEALLKLRRAKLGPQYPDTILSMHNLGADYLRAGRQVEGVALLEEVIKLDTAVLGPEHPETLRAIATLASPKQQELRENQAREFTALLASIQTAVRERRWDDVVSACNQALDTLQREPSWNSPRKALCWQIAAMDEVFDRLAKLRPSDVDLWVGRGRHFAILRDWRHALEQYQHVESALPPTAEQFENACLLLLNDDRAGYERFLNSIRSDEKTPRARIAALVPQSVVPLEQMIQWSNQDANVIAPRPYLLALDAYRAGEFEAAVRSALAVNNSGWPKGAWAQNWLVLSMADQRSGNAADAKRCLDLARSLLNTVALPKEYDPDFLPVPDLLGAEMLVREAEAVLAQPARTPTTRRTDQTEKITRALMLCTLNEFASAEKVMGDVSDVAIEQNVQASASIFRALANFSGGEKRWRDAGARFNALFFGPARAGLDSKWDPLSMDYLAYASVLAEIGDRAGYERLRQSGIEQLGNERNAGERMLSALLLFPCGADQQAAMSKWGEATARVSNSSRYAGWSYVALALLEYRRDDAAKALDWGQKCLAMPMPPTCTARAHILVAMASARLGKTEQAAAELAQCRPQIEAKFNGQLGAGTYDSGFWKDWVIARVLLREADELMAHPQPATQPQ